ncbi:hypothetical protein EGR_06169 [Echinococcus granulosus]|uniref:DNA-directed RNA polymerase I subunit RPA49 n=1 Tax=Echinococcus granulosus TaxID=6210 RepID=W6UCH5_ECHGR|nr:hypothetical protein EGR_06169 [Echinococcus granulosus]EUB58950.1 hypothetical protein EGR_06169 [Echinococcus granulosus]
MPSVLARLSDFTRKDGFNTLFINPGPFSLGTSRADPDEIIPAQVSRGNPIGSRQICCNIKGLKYVNASLSGKDRSYATIIYNKKTAKIEISYNLPEFLSPKFDVEVIDGESSRSLAVDPHALTNTFGSVWGKKYLRDLDEMSAQAAAVNDADVLQRVAFGKAALKKDAKKLGQADIKGGVNGDKVTQQELLLPPFDQITRFVAQIFPIGKILPPAVASSLAKEAKAFSEADESMHKQWLLEGNYPRFIIDRLAYLPMDNAEIAGFSAPGAKRKRQSPDSVGQPVTRMEMAKNLALLVHMFKLFQLKPRELQHRTPLPDTPQPVMKHLLNEFTAFVFKEGCERLKARVITPVLRDKLICHILVLLLHCDSFATVIDTLSVDFKMPSLRLKKYFQFIGCSFTKKETGASSTDQKEGGKQYHTVARLSAPLVFKIINAAKMEPLNGVFDFAP